MIQKLVAIRTFYELRSERVSGVVLYENERDRFEATVSDAARTLYRVKLLALDEGVREYSREEML